MARRTQPSLPATVAVLRGRVDELSTVLRKHAAADSALVEEVVGRFDQFAGLSGGEDAAKLRRSTFDLAAYLLVNQILFYHLHQRRRGGAPELPTKVASRAALQHLFGSMRERGFGPVFEMDLVGRLPEGRASLGLLQRTIADVKALRPEELKQDLLGRLFHELLPPNTRKLLAAFYTKPVAADLLARLAVDARTKSILDPACGSGTLLVAAHHALFEAGLSGHLAGRDLVPFAAHLTALNLSILPRAGGASPADVSSGDSLAPAESIRPVDLVIMNPPYTDRQKAGSAAPREALASVSGPAANLWCDFLALADSLVKRGGRIAAVIPINLLRGKATETLRRHLLANYRWEFIVKTTNEVGFSEGASFRDILFIATKGAPNAGHKVRVALLKERLHTIEAEGGAPAIAAAIREGKSTSDVDCIEFEQAELQRSASDLMEFVGASTAENLRVLRGAVAALRASRFVNPLSQAKLREGFGARPQGLGELIYAMHDNGVESRTRRSILKVAKATASSLHVAPVDPASRVQPFSVPIVSTLPALRNLVGHRTIDAAGHLDYILRENYPALPAVVRLSAWSSAQRGRGAKDRKRAARTPPDLPIMTKGAPRTLTHLALLHRFDPTTPNSHLIAVWSSRKFVPNNNMFAVDLPREQAKAMALFFNSSFFLAQVLLHKQETTRAMMDFKIAEAQDFGAPEFGTLPTTRLTALCRAFDLFGQREHGPLASDYATHRTTRRDIDMAVAIALSLPATEPNLREWIDPLQKVIASELTIMKDMMKGGREAPSSQQEIEPGRAPRVSE